MGWTAHYQFTRSAPLTADERIRLALLANLLNKEPWDAEAFHLDVARDESPDHVVADGWMKLAAPDASSDLERLRKALETVGALLRAELRVTDDFDALESSSLPVEIARDHFVDVATFAPAPTVKLSKKLSALLAGDGVATDARTIAHALRSLATLHREQPTAIALRALLARSAPALVVSAGFRGYGALHRKLHAWSAVVDAMAHVVDVAEVVAAFLTMWRTPKGVYWYHDLWMPQPFSAALAAHPIVEAELLTALREADSDWIDEELVYRRAERAVMMLAHGSTDAGLSALLTMLQATRAVRKPSRHRYFVRIPALLALADTTDSRRFATLALELDRMTSVGRPYIDVVPALARIDPQRARPIVLELVRRSILPDAAVDALAVLGENDRDTQRVLAAFLAHPNPAVATRARHRLVALGAPVDTAVITELPPEELITHPDVETRRRALKTIADRRDRPTCVSLMAAEVLDAMLRQQIDYQLLPFSWHDWKGVLPQQVRNLRPRARLAWALDEGQVQLGPQVVFDAVRPVLERGAASVAAEYPSLLFRLSEADRMALEAEEDAVLRALGATA